MMVCGRTKGCARITPTCKPTNKGVSVPNVSLLDYLLVIWVGLKMVRLAVARFLEKAADREKMLRVAEANGRQ